MYAYYMLHGFLNMLTIVFNERDLSHIRLPFRIMIYIGIALSWLLHMFFLFVMIICFIGVTS